MKLISTVKFLYIVLDCYSTNEDISQIFQYTVQVNDFDTVTDARILHEIENLNLGYDFDVMEITVVERDNNGNFVEREIEY